MSVPATEPKRLYIVTMGCQMNVYDSEQMERMLADMDYRLTASPQNADLILLNTCSIREKAEHKVYSHLGRFARLKRRRSDLIIGVGGCVAQQEGHTILARAPHVDMVFGTFAVRRLPELIRQVTDEKEQVVDIDQTGTIEPSHLSPLQCQARRATAFVPIMSGCDNFCTYCVVPHVRGREVSREPDSILKEIEQLVSAGIGEVTLLGQNVNSYGVKDGHNLDFPALLEAVNNIEGLKRVRFTTSHPKDLSDKLIDSFARLEKLAPHIHLPVQSGSNRTLRRMKRGYTREYYLDRIQRLRQVRTNIAITSDIIVGFPGEGGGDFDETLSLVQQAGFDNLYGFKYSDRPNTQARRFSRKVSEGVKSERLAKLLQLQTKITLNKHRSLVGTIQEVLVEGSSKKSGKQATGRTPCNKVVNLSAAAVSIGGITPVRIVEALSHSLLGELEGAGRKDGGEKGGIRDAA